jgi:hypothetical protein
MTEGITMVREIMSDVEIAYAEAVTGAKANGTKAPRRTGGIERYNRPWNATAPAPVPDHTPAVDRLTRPGGPAAAPLFIVVRPRGDRLVYALIRDLFKLDASAANAATVWYDDNREKLTVAQGSDWITRLRAKIATYGGQPVMSTNGAPPVPVPASADWARWRQLAGELVALGGQHGSRFAVDTGNGAVNELAFWWISPERDGRYFIRQVIGGLGPLRVRMSVAGMIAIAEKIIAAGPEQAMMRYGREIGECGHCGRVLTNDESRAMGIGPRCRKAH